MIVESYVEWICFFLLIGFILISVIWYECRFK